MNPYIVAVERGGIVVGEDGIACRVRGREKDGLLLVVRGVGACSW